MFGKNLTFVKCYFNTSFSCSWFWLVIFGVFPSEPSFKFILLYLALPFPVADKKQKTKRLFLGSFPFLCVTTRYKPTDHD